MAASVSSSEGRFAYLSDAELEELQKKKLAKNTNRATSNAVRTFLAFCQEENYYSIGVIPLVELAKHLTRFYAGARTENGELYKINSMNGLRNGLQRHFLQTRGVDIINDELFNSSNICLKTCWRQ